MYHSTLLFLRFEKLYFSNIWVLELYRGLKKLGPGPTFKKNIVLYYLLTVNEVFWEGHKIWRNLHLCFEKLLNSVKNNIEISSNSAAFSEYMTCTCETKRLWSNPQTWLESWKLRRTWNFSHGNYPLLDELPLGC